MRMLLRCAGPLLLLAVPGLCADSFPAVDGESLLGAKVSLPGALKGHAAVLVLGFTHASQTQTLAWNAKLESLDLSSRTFSIAVLEDAPRLVRGMATSGIRNSVPKNRRNRAFIVVRGEKALKEAVGFDRPDDAYLALIDHDGIIQWRLHGAVTDAAAEDLKNRLTALEQAH
jgi:hypothetical protein